MVTRNTPYFLWAIGCFSLLLLPTLLGARTFEIDEVRYTLDFSSYSLDSTMGDNGWSSSDNANTETVTIVTPSGTGSSSAHVARFDDTGTRRQATLEIPPLSIPDFQLGDTLFISAEIYTIDHGHSGLEVKLRNSGGRNIAGLRVVDVSPKRWGLIGNSTGYYYSESTEAPLGLNWYEVLLAIQIHESDISLSTGSLFYRNLTSGETEFRMVEDLQGINMGFSDTQNPLSIGGIAYANGRKDAELGNIRIGTGTIIPEPGQVAFLLGSTMFGTSLLLHRKRLRKKVNL